MNKLKYKIEAQREQLRNARDVIQDAAADAKVKKLIIEMDQMKNEHENFVASVHRDREASQALINRLE